MKISYSWLKSYLDFTETPEELAEILTDIGLEVEKIEKSGSLPENLEGVVVGEVMEVWQHPNADKLKVTRVDVAEGDDLQIVCGAPNVAQGQKVLVAKVGAVLMPEPEKPFKIKKAKIRGEESYGMICAEDELGLGSNHDGIMVLPQNTEVGISAYEYLNLESDYTFEIGLTPNRTDAFGHFGVARDVAARLNLQKPTMAQLPELDELEFSGTNPTKVEVIDKDGCGRYAGISINGVKVQPSPDWLQERLRSIGINPTNNVVDITNFVLHETGQPLHAFDADQIQDNKILVRTLEEGSKFITLDGIERTLSDQDLMICDSQQGMCIAGVFGGEKSGVKETTKNIFLESAWFNPVRIRKSAKRHALNTDASFRFERGVDPDGTLYALKRAASLTLEICGGKIQGDLIDIINDLPEQAVVDLSLGTLNNLTGLELKLPELRTILESLDIEIDQESGDSLRLRIPRYRVDVTRPADVVEEVLRIKGYNSVNMPDRMSLSVSIEKKPERAEVIRELSNLLASRGFNEAMSNGLTRSDRILGINGDADDTLVRILNPLSQELDVLRPEVSYSMLESIAYNLNRQAERVRLFEIGKSYKIEGAKYAEVTQLCAAITGSGAKESWKNQSGPSDFSDLKGELSAIMQLLGIGEFSLKFTESKSPIFSDQLVIYSGKFELGNIGLVAGKALKSFGIKQNVFLAQIDLDKAISLIKHASKRMTELPKFPTVRRDLSLLLDKDIEFSAIEKIAQQKANKYLRDVDLFDVYEGKNLPSGKKSYAVSFLLRDDKRTLEEKQIEKVMSSIQSELESQLGAELR